jgi:HlyD family secretion protein
MKNRKVLIPAILVLAVAAWLGYRYWEGRAGNDPSRVRVSGSIEVTEAELSFKLPGRVEARLVDEGDLVKVGEVVARLETGDIAQQVALRQADVQAAAAGLADLLAGARPQELAQAAAAVRQAQADFNRIKDDYDRMKALFDQGSSNQREYDAARTAYDVARERLRIAREQQALVQQGPRPDAVKVARARLLQAQEGEKLAEIQLGYATLASPLTGMVLSKNVEPGEMVAPGTPVVTVGDLEHVYMRAYIEETDLGRVKLGQQVLVATDTYPNKIYEGKITFISPQAEFTPKNVQTKQERVKLVYRVKVDIANPEFELKPGMPAEAEIVVGEGKV